MRVEQRSKSIEREDQQRPGTSGQGQGHGQYHSELEGSAARERTDKILLDAEKFKATLVAPKGMLPIDIDSNIELLRKLDNDDDFFHVSCHIDPLLRSKIERRDFIELERLLPKARSAGGAVMGESSKLELVMKDGQPYFGTPQPENRISGVRKWDQAFRIYATIYTQANPHRASEIWQYVDIIHTAANTYQWDNLAYYDFTFRQLMAAKPWRSWAKTYTQGWNLALKDPVGLNKSFNHGNQNLSGNGKQQMKDWKENCCWRFNKNRCSKSNNECEWDHRCTYCGVWNHSFYNCRKHKKHGSNGSTGSSGNSSGNNNNKNHDNAGAKFGNKSH